MRLRLPLLISALSITIFMSVAMSAHDCLAKAPAPSATVSIQSTGVSLSMDPGGAYSVELQGTSWNFGGALPAAPASIGTAAGSDGIGAYQEIQFSYVAHNINRSGSIRAYQGKPVVLFTTRYVGPSNNTDPFPVLSSYPRSVSHLSYIVDQFSPHTFSTLGANGPWVFFDPSARSFILSPAANFMVASMGMGPDGTISSGIDSSIPFLPQAFQHGTFLVFGKGINEAFDTWGHAMTDFQGKTRPANDADAGLKYLGYWTDNGASYYYRYQQSLGYAGTLLAVRDYFNQINLPLGYMQLDSWWYPKGADAHWGEGGGIYLYQAHPALFPNGLKVFQQQLGLPMITHSRWIDPASPYHSEYPISNQVSADPRFWDSIASYIKDAGVITYEQDWLNEEATAAMNLPDQEGFMGNMARSTKAAGLTLQYCMPEPRHYLQSSKYDNLTSIRVSNDRFIRDRWDNFIYGSRMASAMGIWPWADVFYSTEPDNLLMATLSAGMVGVGDSLGNVNSENLRRSVRADGVIVKPDVPLVPTDATIMADAQGGNQPAVAFTSTDLGSSKALYVLSYDRGTGKPTSFTPSLLAPELSGQVYVYNAMTDSGSVVDATSTVTDPRAGSLGYYIVAPIGPSGIGFLGDADKSVSLGKQRITQVADNGTLTVGVAFAAGEHYIALHGYSPSWPTVSANQGSAGQVFYQADKKQFMVVVSPGSDGTASIQINQPGPLPVPVFGLTARYYNNPDFTELRSVRIDKVINFDWSGARPDRSLTVGSFSARWSGLVLPRASDNYTFYVSTAGAVRLWVDGVQLVNDFTSHSLTEDSGSISLAGGQPHDIAIEYASNQQGGGLTLSWSSSSLPKQVISRKRLISDR